MSLPNKLLPIIPTLLQSVTHESTECNHVVRNSKKLLKDVSSFEQSHISPKTSETSYSASSELGLYESEIDVLNFSKRELNSVKKVSISSIDTEDIIVQNMKRFVKSHSLPKDQRNGFLLMKERNVKTQMSYSFPKPSIFFQCPSGQIQPEQKSCTFLYLPPLEEGLKYTKN